jgi:hypothetical protein
VSGRAPRHHQSEPSDPAIEPEPSDGGPGNLWERGGAGNGLGLWTASGLVPTHVDLGHWASAVDFDMRDKDGGLHGDLGVKRGQGWSPASHQLQKRSLENQK